MKPLLAEKVDLETLRYPVLASPKYDGFRCLIHPGFGPVSRNLKDIPNNYVRGKLAELRLDYLDGELLTYTNGKLDDFSTIQSKLSSRQGMPEFRFMVFDNFRYPEMKFWQRLEHVSSALMHVRTSVWGVHQEFIHTREELDEYEAKVLAEGWEGVMLRDPDGIYKYGRSTVKEGILLKLKRFTDDEGKVVGVYERLHNANEATTNSLGYTERSSHQENMVGTNTLGGLTVSWNGVEFDLGTGFNETQRVQLWGQALEGKVVNFKYQGVGPNGKPRFPVFRGFRHD